jgi:class 3 adenylate cyclase
VFETEHLFDHRRDGARGCGGCIGKEPRQVEGCVFANLSGHTRLTEASGDQEAARVSLKLVELVNEMASRHRGTVVKMLGDCAARGPRPPLRSLLSHLHLRQRDVAAGLPVAIASSGHSTRRPDQRAHASLAQPRADLVEPAGIERAQFRARRRGRAAYRERSRPTAPINSFVCSWGSVGPPCPSRRQCRT